ncbi:DUF2956 domain-containing protein [Colwellia sp. E2M01]|uniref:DUF2956 domain-containing protein n=1 Tax=Colwellia sp. E2M01 TaxID=2841561 RepID=UPI001C081E7B|nr:DUF2956 domain-containing protein [Colwellia sp. E2M01]MBU2870001.1 DUF2956 domain-containing protein [Colwellia sp. E2M01]
MNSKVSKETQAQATKVAKGIQKQGQSKEQTKLIAQGIEKGIAEYKKQQSKKARERDKERKQQLKQKQQKTAASIPDIEEGNSQKLPWILLGVSWLGFIGYVSYVL